MLTVLAIVAIVAVVALLVDGWFRYDISGSRARRATADEKELAEYRAYFDKMSNTTGEIPSFKDVNEGVN